MKPNKQLRNHLNFNHIQKNRQERFKKILQYCGDGIFFDDHIKIPRYPGNVSLGNNVVLKEGCRIESCNEKAKISIGDNTTIGYYTMIFASYKITIGKDCLISPFVYIVDSDHGIDRSLKINLQENITEPIFIGDDVWIGAGAKILKGVVIGDGAVIGANAVVNKNINEYQIVAGIPAKVIGVRRDY